MERQYYPAKCCACGREFQAAKSILQKDGMHEHGHGTCKCGEFLNLRFIPGEERFEAWRWADRVAEMDAEIERSAAKDRPLN